jgi:hypothetical protein
VTLAIAEPVLGVGVSSLHVQEWRVKYKCTPLVFQHCALPCTRRPTFELLMCQALSSNTNRCFQRAMAKMVSFVHDIKKGNSFHCRNVHGHR